LTFERDLAFFDLEATGVDTQRDRIVQVAVIIGGLDRIYVELYDLTYAGDGGTVTYSAEVKIGPCVVE